MKKICLLGSTGSIGTQALDVVKNHSDLFIITALAAYSNIALLEKQIREFKPQVVAVFDLKSAEELKVNVKDMDVKVLAGMDGLCEICSLNEVDIVLNSVTGMIGLMPTLTAIENKKDIALANKETLVAGGEIVMKKAKENGVNIFPVDSEHSAIFQCLEGLNDKRDLKRVILTASGGPFFGFSYEELKSVTKERALKHPNWDMGAKVTIDSATMMNKGLELIEAKWLFDLEPEKLDVLVHRESIIHSLVEFEDNSVIAQMGVPDMRIPIQYALSFPRHIKSPVKKLDLFEYQNLSFYKADTDVFKCLSLAMKAMKMGGLTPTVMNAADEEAVKLFLNEKIAFTDIAELIEQAMFNVKTEKEISIESIMEADRKSREYVLGTY